MKQTIQKLYGEYEPTGIYSFEFINQFGTRITEIVMMLPPESVTVSEGQRGELIPTIGGGYYCDYGNEFKEINITGSLYFHYVGSRNNPVAFRPADMLVSGYQEFVKLRYALIRYRDYTLTPNAKKTSPEFFGEALADVQALKEYAGKHQNVLATKVEMVFHDYDYDEHYKVKLEKFDVSRDKSDPFSARYTIQLKAYERYSTTSNKRTEVRQSSTEILLNNDEIMQTLHAESIPAKVPSFSPNELVMPAPSTVSPTSILQDSELFVNNQKLELYRAYYTWAIGMIRSGVLDIEKALAGFPNAQAKNKFASELND